MDSERARIAFLGAEGSFTQEAAQHWCERGQDTWELIGAASQEAVLDMLASAYVERAVLPVANTTGGLVWPTLQALGNRALELLDEVVLEVRFDLFVARAGIALGGVRRVASHPQAFRQCARTLERLLPGRGQEHTSDTASAARALADGSLGEEVAVLASARAGARYELVSLAREVHDESENRTFFAVFGRAAQPGIRLRGTVE